MASFTDIAPLRRLMAPTRAAAHRRRRLRKLGSALCAGLATFILFGSSHQVAPPASATSTPRLAGLHLVNVSADAGIVAAATPGAHVDLWSSRGSPLAKSVPVAKTSSGGSVLGNTASTLLVGLTDAQMTSYAQFRAGSQQASDAILVTLSPK